MNQLREFWDTCWPLLVPPFTGLTGFLLLFTWLTSLIAFLLVYILPTVWSLC